MARHRERLIESLTSPAIATSVSSDAILCLPMGATEQHGPHLPFDTDTVLAERFTQAIIARWGNKYELWQLPSLPHGLSREHGWASGTVSLSVDAMTALLRKVASDIASALPKSNVVAINGHGGNRGILEAIARELAGDFGLNFCAMHLGAMMSPPTGADFVEIHGGKDETSAVLALAPELVRREQMAQLNPPADAKAVQWLILDPKTTWPWSSDDPRIAHMGVIGDARAATAEHGKVIVDRVVEAAGEVFERLLANRRR